MAADENLSDEVPEADALEQRQDLDAEVVDEEAPSSTTDDVRLDDSLEVPEADALEQSRVVPTDDEPIPEE